MNIFYHISPFPALDEDMVAKVYEAQSPLAEIDSIILAKPHAAPQSVTFNGLDNLTHIVRLFSAVSGTLLHEYDVQPTIDTANIFDPISFKIGDGGANTPAALSNTYTNPVLAALGPNDYVVYRKGAGFLKEGVDYGNNIGVGGFTLSVAGDRFEDLEDFLIQRVPKVVTTPVNDSVVGKIFGGFIDVNALTDYDPAHLRKLVRLSGVAAWYRFPAALGVNVPMGYSHRFTNFGVVGEDAKVIFDNAPLLWGGAPVTFLDIPFSATCEFTFDGANWNCVMYNSVPAAATNPVAIISHIGSIAIGDVVTDTLVNVPIPDQGTLAYKIAGTLIGNSADWNKENDVMYVIVQKATNSFKIALREVAANTQNLTFEFAIIK